MSIVKFISCLACLLIFHFSPLRAADWPQWLGEERDSIWRETGIVEAFPEEGLKTKWRKPIAGGYAGPAVADGRVFVADYVVQAGDPTPSPSVRNELQGTERVKCFDAKTGELLWQHEYDCPYQISYPAGPRATPTVNGGRVYTLGAMGNLFCLDAKTGAVVWSRDFQKDFGADVPIWGFCGHPLIADEKLFCLVGGEGVAVAFNKETGKEIWRNLRSKGPGYAPPTMIEAAGLIQLLIWHETALCALNPTDGSQYWCVPLEPDYGMSIATPRKENEYLFVGGIVNKSMLLELGQDDPSAEVVWRGRSDIGIAPVNSTPIISDGYIYGIDHQGELRCVEVATGWQVWSNYDLMPGKQRTNSGTAFLVKQGNRYFIMPETGELVIANLSPAGYEEISRAKILEPTGDSFGRPVVWSHPAFANRCIYARNDKELVCVSLAAGD